MAKKSIKTSVLIKEKKNKESLVTEKEYFADIEAEKVLMIKFL